MDINLHAPMHIHGVVLVEPCRFIVNKQVTEQIKLVFCESSSPLYHPPQVTDEVGLQIWRAVVNMLNKLSWTAGKGVVLQLEVGRGANNPSAENK
jgi:hypothetical protein